MIRAETPLKEYTLIEHSNTLIEQSDLLATEIRMSIVLGIIARIKNNGRIFWEILEGEYVKF